MAAAGSQAGEWEPVRRLRAPGLRVALEDTDPYRDCAPWAVAPRLTGAGFARWQDLFAAAWREIETRHDAFAPGLAAGLTTLVPLSGVSDDRAASATTRYAPGTVALALSADPVTMALLLICGFQQVKLRAVADLYDLYDPADDQMFPAPWGEGKQHLDGLFRDTYAHLAGTHFWQARQSPRPGDGSAVTRAVAGGHARRHPDPGKLRLADPARSVVRGGHAGFGPFLPAQVSPLPWERQPRCPGRPAGASTAATPLVTGKDLIYHHFAQVAATVMAPMPGGATGSVGGV